MKSTEPTNIFKLGVKETGQSAPTIVAGKLWLSPKMDVIPLNDWQSGAEEVGT